jgi:hypothetical protein
MLTVLVGWFNNNMRGYELSKFGLFFIENSISIVDGQNLAKRLSNCSDLQRMRT